MTRYALSSVFIAVLLTVVGAVKAVRVVIDSLDDALTLGSHR